MSGVSGPRLSTVPFKNLNSFSFDGIDEHFIGTSTYSELDGQNKMTLSLWMKPISGAPLYEYVVTVPRSSNANEHVFSFQHFENNYLNFSIDGRTMKSALGNISAINYGQWNHVLCCLDGTLSGGDRMKIYVNGVDETYQTGIGTFTALQNASGGLMIGEEPQGAYNPYKGFLDEVAIWRGTDQRANVSEIYGGGQAVDLNNLATVPPPTTWQRMGKEAIWNGQTWIMVDVNGGYTNRSINMVEVNRTTDVPPNPFVNTLSTYFDGLDDRVEINNTLTNGYAELSVSTWVKYNNNLATSNQYHPIVARQGSLGNSFVLQNMRSGASSNGGELYFGVNTPNGTFNAFSGVIPSQNVWYNIVGTYDGSNVKIYMDGVLKATLSASGNINTNSTILYLGDSGYGGYSQILNGNLDEVSIYSRGLTQSEVTDIFGQGVPSDVSSISDIVAYWRMGDGDTANTITDNVGSNNGTMVNMNASNFVTDVPTASSFTNTKSILLDGIDDFVQVADNSNLSFGNGSTDSPFSISFWVNLNSLSGNNNVFIGKDSGSSNREYGIGMFSNNNYVRFFIKNQGGNNQQSVDSTTNLTTGSWFHIVVTYNGSGGSNAADGMNIYVNAVQETTGLIKQSYTAMSNTVAPFTIGKYSASPSQVNGKMDEVAVFNSELSQSDITTIYNGGVPNDISSLSPLSWWRCGDSDTSPTLTDNGSGGNDGTMTNFSAFSTDVPT